MNTETPQYKNLFKSELASVYEISLKALRLRLEIMEEEKKISPGWRRIKVLNSAIVAAYIAHWGKPAEHHMKRITVKV